MSAKTIERLYQRAILTSLDITEHRRDLPFQVRLDQAVRDLRSAFTTKPYPFQVYYPIEGLELDELPFSFGNVSFRVLSPEDATALIQNLEHQQVRSRKRNDYLSVIDEMMHKGIVGRPMGVTTVMATESEAAKVLAIKELRLTLDVMNFFSDLIPYSNGYFFLPGDRSRTVVTTLITSSNAQHKYSVGGQVVGPLAPLSAKMLGDTEQTRQMGLAAANRVLVERKGAFQERLLSAIQWAGRATVEIRKEESFLLYAIALESLVLVARLKSFST
jgi:hypothetical protein